MTSFCSGTWLLPVLALVAVAMIPAAASAADDARHPFPQRLSVPDFPKDLPWLNTSGPLRKQDLKGKFVLLDFWTYCCINCIHILPELKKLERAYPDTLVVIGVHSAKFETERDSKNIAEAILRYEIEHPVVVDSQHQLWNVYGVNSWPTVLLIDPEGSAIWGRSGEIEFADVDEVLKRAIPHYRRHGVLDTSAIRFDLLAHRQQATPLRFPGKVVADEAGRRLFIADSNHNRIVITDLDGRLRDIVGSGQIGRQDGDFAKASFDHPQGMVLRDNTLYVADTENHMLRKVDLEEKTVATIAGTGKQNRALSAAMGAPSAKPRETALNSPWDLWWDKTGLYIAMAGPHQIWRMKPDESAIGPYAGNGREDIVDGRLLPTRRYAMGYSSFAQPSGLSSDGEWLYVADSEGSSIRAVPFDPKQQVRTVVGTAHLSGARLFTFGDRDGPREQALLQHCLGVAWHDGVVYVADTYNNKIKAVDAKTGAVRTLAGTGKPGTTDDPAAFDEPGGISFAAGKLYVADTNNHAIRTIDLASGKVGTLRIDGLKPPAADSKPARSSFPGAVEAKVAAVTVKPEGGKVTFVMQLNLPTGWKINPDAPMSYRIEAVGRDGPLALTEPLDGKVEPPAATARVTVPVRGPGRGPVRLSLNYYYCQASGEGLCKMGSVVWPVPLAVSDTAADTVANVTFTVEP